MIVVVIVGILAAVAMPIYGRYVRKSRTSEAISNLGAIAMFEETFYSESDSYVTLDPNPSTVPSSTDLGGRLPFNTGIGLWNLLGRVMPNGTKLFFQYRAYAGQYNTGTSGVTGGTGGLVAPTTTMTLPSGAPCTATPASFTANGVGIPVQASSNWYFIVAVGDQKKTSSPNKCSVFLKVIDRPDISITNEIE